MCKDLNRNICQRIMARCETQNLKGKARDKASIEMLLGAAMALEELNESDKSDHLLMVTSMLVVSRGYKEVVRLSL